MQIPHHPRTHPGGITQLRRCNNRDAELPEGSNRLLTYNLCMIATSRETAKVSTIGGREEHYLEWKDPYPTTFSAVNPGGQPPGSQQRLIHGVLAPDRLLEILRNFTVFRENDQGKRIKTTTRYQQYRAVRKILARLRSDREPKEKGRGDDPCAPDRIDCDARGSPGPVYRELLDRIRGGVEVHLLDRMRDERDLSWIAGCVYTGALLHTPGGRWRVIFPCCRRSSRRVR